MQRFHFYFLPQFQERIVGASAAGGGRDDASAAGAAAAADDDDEVPDLVENFDEPSKKEAAKSTCCPTSGQYSNLSSNGLSKSGSLS